MIPFVAESGFADRATTGVFEQVARERTTGVSFKDALALAMRFEDKGTFHSGAPLKSILAAARAEGIDACLLGVVSPYSGTAAWPALLLEVKLVETNRGEILWTKNCRKTGHEYLCSR